MSLPERLSSLSGGKDDHHSSVAARRERDKNAEPPDGSVAGLVQRCVIIQRDEKGYGFTVTGDNPVFVASVKPDGAASRAGVQNSDRIVKVNGTLVTSKNHLDVVKLIKSGSYVALTLLGKPQKSELISQPIANPSVNTTMNRDSMISPGIVTAPQPVNADKDRELAQHKIHMTKAMYETAVEDYQKLERQFTRNPSEKLHNQLSEKKRTVDALGNQLQHLSADVPSLPTTPTSLISKNRYSDSEHGSLEQFAGQSWASSLPSATSDLSSMSDSPHTSPSISPTPNESMMSLIANRHNGQDSEDPNLMRQEIIHDEDEDMCSEDIQANDPGPFVDIKSLESKPAHMAVLLNYLISNMDPSPVLFYIISNAYSRCSASIKELRKWAYEIYSVFIAQGCPLNIGLDDKENIINQMDSILITAASRTDNESALRSMFDPAHACIQGVIVDLLTDFRNKKDLGMANFYGFNKLQDNMDKTSAGKVAEEILSSYLESVAVGAEEINSGVNDKDMATGWALATFLRLNGVGGSSKSSHGTGWDRIPSFMMKDKKVIKFPVSRSGRAKSVKGHQFTNQHFYVTTICLRCGHLIWGVGYQGFQCQSCEMTVHKQCVDDVTEVCGGKRKRVSRFPVPRKPSTISTNSLISNQSQGSNTTETSSLGGSQDGPGSGSGGPIIQPIPRDDDGDLGFPTGHSVKSIAKRYEENSPLDPTSSSPMTTSTTSSGGFDGLDIPGQSGTPGSVGNGVRRGSSDLNRSGSLNKKEEKGGKRNRRAKSDVEMDSETFKAINQSGSSSTSSMSNRSGESPSTSTDNVHEQEELDKDVEPELPPLKQVLGEDVLRKLKPKEKKRQEVINELMYTERAHLRNLRVLDKIFNQPMRNEMEFMAELAKALFPNLDEMIKLHESITKDFKDRREENPVISTVGDILLRRFDGENGEVFRKGCAEYCRNQAHTLEALKRQTRKESKLAQFLSDAESKPVCRRLHLRDLVPSQMQRLTKYPLLIENLTKYTTSSSEEQKRLQRALERCKHILSYVNQAVKECENYHKLKEIQKKLDKKSLEASVDPAMKDIKNLKLVEKKLIFDGPLTWKLKQNRTIELHVLLLEDMLVLLQKQDDKYVLKYQNSSVPSMRDTQTDYKYTHSPVLKLRNLLARDVATDEKSFFVVNLSEVRAQMYELIASTKVLRKQWGKVINECAEELKKMDAERPASSRPLSAAPSRQMDRLEVETAKIGRQTLLSDPGHDADKKEEDMDQLDSYTSLGGEEDDEEEEEEGGLVQPNEVCVSNVVTAQATAIRTPLELLRHNSDVIATALEERHRLLAQLLELPQPQSSSPLKQQPSCSSSTTATPTTTVSTTAAATATSSFPSPPSLSISTPLPPSSSCSPSPSPSLPSSSSAHPNSSNQPIQSEMKMGATTATPDKSPPLDVTQVNIQVEVNDEKKDQLESSQEIGGKDGDKEMKEDDDDDGKNVNDGSDGIDKNDEVDDHDDNNNLEGTLLLRAVTKVREFTLLVIQAEDESAVTAAQHHYQLLEQHHQQQQQQQRQRRASADSCNTSPISPNRRMSGLAEMSSDIHSSQIGSTPLLSSRPVLSSSSSLLSSPPPPSSSSSSSSPLAALSSKPPLPPLSQLSSSSSASSATTTSPPGEKGKVAMPLDQLKEMMTEMNAIMAKLMSTVNNGNEEKKRLHQELKEARAKLDVLKDMQKQMIISGAVPPDRITDENDQDYLQQQQQGPSYLSSPKMTQPPLSPSSFSPPASPLSPSSSLSSPSVQYQQHHSLQTSTMEEESSEVHHGIQEAVEMAECVETLDSAPSTQTATVVGDRMTESVDKDEDDNKVIEVAMEDDDDDDDDIVNTNVSVADLPLPDMASVPVSTSDGTTGGESGSTGVESSGSDVTSNKGGGSGLLDNVELEEMSDDDDDDDNETIVGKGEGSPDSSHDDSVQAVDSSGGGDIGDGSTPARKIRVKGESGGGDNNNEDDDEEEEYDDAIEI